MTITLKISSWKHTEVLTGIIIIVATLSNLLKALDSSNLFSSSKDIEFQIL